MTIDEIAETFANIDDEDGDDEDLDGGDEDEQSDDVSSVVDSDASNEKPAGPPKISALGFKRVRLDASVKLLSRGANQRASRTFTQKLASADAPWHIVIRSVNRWCDDTMNQDYALAVSLRRDDDRTEIYAELAARLEAIVEVRIEVEVEAELEL